MGLFQSAKSTFQLKVNEEYLYTTIVNEMANGQVSNGLYAKALASANGDEQQTKAIYIKLRADMMKAEMAAIAELSQEAKAAEARAKKAEPSPPKSIDEFKMGRWVASVFILIGLLLIFSDLVLLGICDMIIFTLIWIFLGEQIKRRESVLEPFYHKSK